MLTSLLRNVMVLVFGLAPAVLSAQQIPTLLVDADHRAATSLDGDWHYIVDPYLEGFGSGSEKRNAFALNHHFEPGGPLVEYDFAKAPLLKVPGDWNTQNDRLYYYEGMVWYQRDFEYHAKAGHKVFLRIGAANYKAYVFVNGEHICDHEGGFTPFDCDVTSVLKPDGNFVVIGVENIRKPERVPTMNTDWWNYGGLTRDVSLIEVPDAFIDDYTLSLVPDGKTIRGYVHVSGAQSGSPVTVHIAGLRVDQTRNVDEAGRAAFDVKPVGLERWAPGHPKLYEVELKTDTDLLRDEVGFRTVSVDGDRILLNGQPLFLRGVSVHAEAPYRTGRAYTERDVETLLGWVQELHCNFVRLAHYPHDERMTRLADRKGILVWSEVPVYWGIQWANADTYRGAQQQLDDEIRRDRNKASIVLWSVANETPISDERSSFLRRLADEARAKDGTRLVTAALLPHETTHPDGTKTIVLDDPLGQYLDVIGLNEYVGWYSGTPDDLAKLTWEDPLHKPVIASEFGAGAKAGLHGSDTVKFTEEYQARLFRDQLAMFERTPFVVGMTPWVLMDFRSPVRKLPGIQDDFNRKGLISEQGQKKEAFQVLSDFYARKASGMK